MKFVLFAKNILEEARHALFSLLGTSSFLTSMDSSVIGSYGKSQDSGNRRRNVKRIDLNGERPSIDTYRKVFGQVTLPISSPLPLLPFQANGSPVLPAWLRFEAEVSLRL